MAHRVERSVTAKKRRGSALIEISLLLPWFLFLFVGIVDCGFYYVSLISVENAARVGAEYTSKNASADPCSVILADLAMLPGVPGLSNCNSLPLVVTSNTVTGPDGRSATEVSVQYQTKQLIPIPGLLTGKLTFTRDVKMRIKP